MLCANHIRPNATIILFAFLVGCTDDPFRSENTENHPPVIVSLESDFHIRYLEEQTEIRCVANDSDGDSLQYSWIANRGNFILDINDMPTVTWRAPAIYLSPSDSLTASIGVHVYDQSDSSFEQIQIKIFNGDLWNDTGEPFIDRTDGEGLYNRQWDPGEIFLDLPSNEEFGGIPSRNGRYDGPDGMFDDYELFTAFADIDGGDDPRLPVTYTWVNILEEFPAGDPEWLNLPDYLLFIPDTSTWSDRNGDGAYQEPN